MDGFQLRLHGHCNMIKCQQQTKVKCRNHVFFQFNLFVFTFIIPEEIIHLKNKQLDIEQIPVLALSAHDLFFEKGKVLNLEM